MSRRRWFGNNERPGSELRFGTWSWNMSFSDPSVFYRLNRDNLISSGRKVHASAFVRVPSSSVRTLTVTSFFTAFCSVCTYRCAELPSNNFEHAVKRNLPPMQVELEQRIVIKFLPKKNMYVHEIVVKLQAHLKDKAYALRTVRLGIGEVWRGREDRNAEHRSGRPLLNHIDTKILHILGKFPFGSARSIAQMLNTSHSVLLHHLHKVLRFKRFHLWRAPDFLTDDLRLKRKQAAREMIPYLEAVSRDGWQYFVTGHESWFFLDQSLHWMWCLARDAVSTVVRRDTHIQRFIFTIMWIPRRFQVVNQLSSDTKLDSDYFSTNMLASLREKYIPRDRAPHSKPLVFHMDNCSIHTSDTTQRFMSQH
jgi:hypothetical protein